MYTYSKYVFAYRHTEDNGASLASNDQITYIAIDVGRAHWFNETEFLWRAIDPVPSRNLGNYCVAIFSLIFRIQPTRGFWLQQAIASH